MLKKFSAFGLLLATLLAASFANAGLITDVVEIDQRVVGTHTYSHNLNNHDFILGTAESASLAIEIYDDASCHEILCADEWFPEVLVVIVEEMDFDTGGVTFGSFFGDLEVQALVALNSNGFLDVTVSTLWGDFMMGDSTLSVTTSSVPEPGAIGLLLMSLFGLGLARRKARS